MRTIGLFQAKNGLSALVQKVSEGEEFMITRRGKEVAMLVPARPHSRRSPREVIEHIRQTREGARLPKGYTLRRLIEEGRRF
ncbi:MAG: type II toxin-antitoxin system Phd/YefM family antitoxin [Terriglobia bacterium]